MHLDQAHLHNGAWHHHPTDGIFSSLLAHHQLRISYFFYDWRTTTAAEFFTDDVPGSVHNGHAGDIDLAVVVTHRQLFLRHRMLQTASPGPTRAWKHAETLSWLAALVPGYPEFGASCFTTTHQPQQKKNGEGQHHNDAHDELMRLTTFPFVFSLRFIGSTIQPWRISSQRTQLLSAKGVGSEAF
jgi:hypothetical protein